MRSLRKQRSASRGRVKSGRRATNGGRIPEERLSFGRRKPPRNDIVSRALRSLRERLSFRRPMLLLTLSLIVATALVALFVSGKIARAANSVRDTGTMLVADAGFGIEAVHLSGNRRTPPRMILNALGFEPGQSIFAADVQDARARLMQLDWVADAEVRRRYPDTISVSIVEKLPFARWDSKDGMFVVERSGRTITPIETTQFARLPFFVGDAPVGGAELVDAIALHRAVSARVKAMERVSQRRWNLILDDGVVVQLPEKNWAKQLDVLEHLIVDKGVLERDLLEIDLRQRDNYFFLLRSGQKQKVTRGDAA
jgi:cell division protein FtsQ